MMMSKFNIVQYCENRISIDDDDLKILLWRNDKMSLSKLFLIFQLDDYSILHMKHKTLPTRSNRDETVSGCDIQESRAHDTSREKEPTFTAAV